MVFNATFNNISVIMAVSHKENIIRNIKKNNNQNWLNNKQIKNVFWCVCGYLHTKNTKKTLWQLVRNQVWLEWPKTNSKLYSGERIVVLNFQKDWSTKTKLTARKPLCLQTDVRDYIQTHRYYNMTGKCLQSCDKYHSPFMLTNQRFDTSFLWHQKPMWCACGSSTKFKSDHQFYINMVWIHCYVNVNK